MTDAQQRLLRDAFACLERGRWQSFNHNLWRAFGESWLDVRKTLAHTGRITFDPERSVPTITPAGLDLERELIGRYGEPSKRAKRPQPA